MTTDPANWLPCGGPGPLGNLLLGLRVLGSELAFALPDTLRRLEISQIRKRINAEQRRLAELPQDADPAAREKADGLLAFLRDDAELLSAERTRVRREFVAKRLQRLGLSGLDR